MLQYLAQQESTTTSAVLTRELEDVACAQASELSEALSGFAAALAWPYDGQTHQTC
jgi:hypothetical protein